MVNYHPSDELLMQFAAGQMSDALGLAIACHLEKCTQCRQRATLYERVGGELLDHSTPVAVSDTLFDSILTQLDEAPEQREYEAENVVITPNPRVPKPLRRFVPDEFSKLKWTGMNPNIKEFKLNIQDPQYTAKFYKITAGKELPQHTHHGNEFTLVMQGSFSDRAGDYHAGDFVLADTTTIHQPRASEMEDCICFAVTDAPLKMTGFFGRFLNPFLS